MKRMSPQAHAIQQLGNDPDPHKRIVFGEAVLELVRKDERVRRHPRARELEAEALNTLKRARREIAHKEHMEALSPAGRRAELQRLADEAFAAATSEED